MNTPFLKDLADKARCGLRGRVELGNPERSLLRLQSELRNR